MSGIDYKWLWRALEKKGLINWFRDKKGEEPNMPTLIWKYAEKFHQSSRRSVEWYHLGRGKDFL